MLISRETTFPSRVKRNSLRRYFENISSGPTYYFILYLVQSSKDSAVSAYSGGSWGRRASYFPRAMSIREKLHPANMVAQSWPSWPALWALLYAWCSCGSWLNSRFKGKLQQSKGTEWKVVTCLCNFEKHSPTAHGDELRKIEEDPTESCKLSWLAEQKIITDVAYVKFSMFIYIW